MSLEARWQSHLDTLHQQGRYRVLQHGAGIDFTSNDYLGYASDFNTNQPPLPRSGTASRLLRGHHPVWDEVESLLASWHQAETALVMTSGYVANLGLLATAIAPNDWVASDACNHASIVDGLRLARAERFVYRHQDLEHLEQGLRAASARRPPQRELFVVTESLFSMEGDATPLAELVRIAQRHGAHVIVDEAHATGCFGATGSGRVDALGLRPNVLATMHTGGKALAVAGAYVCGSAMLKQLLVNGCRPFLFSTALPPALGAWWLDVLAKIPGGQQRRQQLHANARLFREELKQHRVPTRGDNFIVPIVLGDTLGTVHAATRLQRLGFDIRAIRPPTVPEGASRLRIAIHADHDAGTLRAAATAVAEACHE
jgi:8-amino-7-oxononanoate synthase